MWFRFPDGVTELSCQQQNFRSEFKDKDNHHYFRAPNHFVSFIKDLPGFGIIGDPLPGMPEDLPPEDPIRDETIAGLAQKVQVLETTISNLQADLAEVKAERDGLKLQNHEMRVQIEEMEVDDKNKDEKLDEKPYTPPPAKGKS